MSGVSSGGFLGAGFWAGFLGWILVGSRNSQDLVNGGFAAACYFDCMLTRRFFFLVLS
jgi:hypothetical protein